MSSRPERIPIPWPQRLEDLRERVLPIVFFVVTIAACGWLWKSHLSSSPVLTGHVRAATIDVWSPYEGVLVDVGNPAGGADPLLSQVLAGDVVARIKHGVDGGEVGDISAPTAGAVTRIIAHAGAYVRKGDPLLTITSPTPQYVLCYYPEFAAPAPVAGQPVALRLKQRGADWGRSTVEAVGPAIEVKPTPVVEGAMPELGWPVRIALPEGVNLPAGASVEIRFGQLNG